MIREEERENVNGSREGVTEKESDEAVTETDPLLNGECLKQTAAKRSKSTNEARETREPRRKKNADVARSEEDLVETASGYCTPSTPDRTFSISLSLDYFLSACRDDDPLICSPSTRMLL